MNNANKLSEKVVKSKTALMTALAEHSSQYLANMKLWFRGKWTKEEFDSEARKFLTSDKVHLHNQFLIAILNKIDAFHTPNYNLNGDTSQQTSTHSNKSTHDGTNKTRKRKRSSRVYSERVVFEPCDMLDFLAEDSLQCIRAPDSSNDIHHTYLPTTQRYCAQELFLPDAGLVLGRFLVNAWECGLTTVDDNVAEYMAMAIQVLLKNLISAIIMKKKHYKTTGEGSYYYDVGALLRDPTLRNTVTRQKIDDGPLELDKEITSPSFIRRSNEEGVFLSACEDM